MKLIVNNQCTGVSTFASPASPSKDQSLQKSFHLSYSDKIELKKISSPFENNKYAIAQTSTTLTKTVKLNKDNGLQTRWTKNTSCQHCIKAIAGEVVKSRSMHLTNFGGGGQVNALKSATALILDRYDQLKKTK